jgi:mRNA interferase MazF
VVRRGEVWLYEPPDEKRRPVLILTRDEDIDRQFDVIAVPITSTIRGWGTEVELGVTDGMDRDCVLTIHNTLSADKLFLTRRITTLGSHKMTEVCRTLAKATGC